MRVALATMTVLLLAANHATAQSLAELAAKEKKRREAMRAKNPETKVITESDLAARRPKSAATAEPADGGFVLNGTKAYVLAAASAGLVVAPFRVGDETALFAVELPTAGVEVAAEIGIDPTRRTGRIRFEGTRVQ